MINNLQVTQRHFNHSEFNWWSDSVALRPQFSMSLLVTSVQQHYRLWLLYLLFKKLNEAGKNKNSNLGTRLTAYVKRAE